MIPVVENSFPLAETIEVVAGIAQVRYIFRGFQRLKRHEGCTLR